MREKIVVTDPGGASFRPKSLGCFFSRKRTAQTGLFIAARKDRDGVTLWFSCKWRTRVLKELEDILAEYAISFETRKDSWRMRMTVVVDRPPEELWNGFVRRWKSLGYDIAPVRSFRRFAR